MSEETEQPKENGRRIRVLYVERQDVFRMIMGFDGGTHLSISKFTGVPEDCRVLFCGDSFQRNAIGFILEHPSFELVSLGEMAPEAVSSLRNREVVQIVRADGE